MTVAGAATADYTSVTEVPGLGASREEIAMLCTRYAFAAGLCRDARVLEIACGAGLGLGRLGCAARWVVGGDYTEPLLRRARLRYGPAIPLVRLDAHVLPFRRGSFDVAVLYEAIYYLRDAARAVGECLRVLRPGGTLTVCTVNREWADFNPSPLSTSYLSGRELVALLETHGFRVELYAAFPASVGGLRDHVVSWVKRGAVAAGVMPRTMKGKQWLKRVVFGGLVPLPAEVTDAAGPSAELRPVSADAPISGYKVLYAVGRAPA